ncbi:glutamine synthetase beta-grasp domain-containing protein [Candidatus Bipolaricaulota bacterium]|jgi:glutamine synthetase|nr:glutamine synthetase beta-grasp domain-containing protein [Candidatus Bipolaricaulota bacterium]
MTDYASLKHLIDEQGIQSVDFRVADFAGRFRHLTIPSVRFTPSLIADGLGFDGSNYGYRAVAGSDMVLIPDLSSAYVEERSGEKVLSLIADIRDAETRGAADIDPRGIARAAVAYAQELGIADEILVSPEFEFYVFNDVFYDTENGTNCVEIHAAEACDHRAGIGNTPHSAYHAPLHQDRLFEFRCDVVRQIEKAGIPVKYHHHEVGAFGQQEIELGFDSLVRMADATLIVKSLVHNTAVERGLTATFLPKPIHGQAGNGMHLHQYLVKDGINLFSGENGLTELALCYVGGLLKHGRSLMAWTNPSTNSFRRLVPGYEAPVNLVFGSANRTAAVRVPSYAKGDKRRIELRTMDATCNPYLAFAAILMAGIDGIQQGFHAEEMGYGPFEADLYEKNHGEAAPRNLPEALDSLAEDCDYLCCGDVFSEEEIEHWIQTKRAESDAVAQRPHPHEFVLYYDM